MTWALLRATDLALSWRYFSRYPGVNLALPGVIFQMRRGRRRRTQQQPRLASPSAWLRLVRPCRVRALPFQKPPNPAARHSDRVSHSRWALRIAPFGPLTNQNQPPELHASSATLVMFRCDLPAPSEKATMRDEYRQAIQTVSTFGRERQ
jgi:hypothetical protein